MKTKLWLVFSALLFILAGVTRANAHDARATAIFLDVGEGVMDASLELPLDQLTIALGGEAPDPDATPKLPATEEVLKAYVLQHFSVEGRDAKPFEAIVSSVRIERVGDGGDSAVAHVSLRAPPGGSARWFKLHFNGIVHAVVSHNVYVFIRRDLPNGVLGEKPVSAGFMHYQRTTLVVDRSGGTFFRGLSAVFLLGMKHIAEGTDHLLFLFMLLLSAPQIAIGGRWQRTDQAGRSVRETVKIVTAFTIGHSFTLIVVAVKGASLPSRPVESLIALSILVSGAHALRPLFPGREAIVAGLFGLLHGLGFAAVMTGFGFEGSTLAVAVLGFNLGVEVMQLGIVVVTMPWLIVASRSEHFGVLRILCGVFGCVAAVGYLVERAFALRTPVPAVVEAIAGRSVWLLAALVVTAVVLANRAKVAQVRAQRVAQPLNNSFDR